MFSIVFLFIKERNEGFFTFSLRNFHLFYSTAEEEEEGEHEKEQES